MGSFDVFERVEGVERVTLLLGGTTSAKLKDTLGPIDFGTVMVYRWSGVTLIVSMVPPCSPQFVTVESTSTQNTASVEEHSIGFSSTSRHESQNN